MTEEDTRSLPAAAQAALRNRAVRAVLDGMTQAEAARVFGVHHNAVNRWINATGRAAGQGLPNGAAVAVPASRPPCPNRSNKRLSRSSVTRPPTSSVWRDSCGLVMRSPS
jgi:hypothetical protein